MDKGRINRLQSTRLIGPMVDKHWSDLRLAHQQGKKVAWCAGPLTMLTVAMDIPSHFLAGYASYCAGRKQVTPLLEAAEADGYLRETCSYHRLNLGFLSLVRKGVPVREDISIPPPDLMICSRLCPEHSHYADSIYRQFHIPVVAVDLPPAHRESDIKGRTIFVERQLREEAIPAIERIVGRPYNYDRLSEILAIVKKAAILRNECLETFRNIPAPWTLFDVAVSMAPLIYTMGEPGIIEYYEKLKEELEERVANGITAIPEERYRLYWDHLMMWNWIDTFPRKLAALGANLIVGRYPYSLWPNPETIEPERPLHTIAAQTMGGLAQMFSPEYARRFIAQSIEKYSLNGLIMLSSRTCRVFNMGQQDFVDEMERTFGTPGIIIEADQIDPQFYSEAQLDTRLQALFEMIEARKQVRRR